MSNRNNSHVITELFDRNIKGKCEVRKAQKCLFAWSFKCHNKDEYNTVFSEESPNSTQQETEPPIYACKFGEGSNYGHMLVLANEDGQIGLRDTRKPGSPLAVEGQQIHQSAIFDVCWVPGSSELVSVAGDQRASVVAVRDDGHLTVVQSLLGHTRSIKTVHVNPTDPCVLATGARDGTIIIWDKRCKPHHRADEIAPAHQSHVSSRSTASPGVRRGVTTRGIGSGGGAPSTSSSVTAVLFQQQHTLISSGSSDGLIKLWDLRKTHSGGRREPQCQYSLEYGGKSSLHGFISLTLSQSRDMLYTSCMDNIIYAYHLVNPTPKPVATYSGHMAQTYFVKSCLSPCGSYLLSGSSNNAAYIWLTESPGQPVAKLTGHFAEISAVDWCPVDNEKLVTCADDMKLRVFRPCNTNLDDFDEKLNIRGVSERYMADGMEITHGIHIYRPSHDTGERSSSESQEPTSVLPVTPSTSRVRLSYASTPSSDRREGLSNTPHSQSNTPHQNTSISHTPSTPHSHQTTPSHRHQGRGRVTPRTPKTNERNTLLQWLATAKTPGTRDSPGTIQVSVSDSKKEGLKRKLTDYLGEEVEAEKDQENLNTEVKAISPTSPSKKILGSSSVVNTATATPVSAAKMLKYGDDVDSKACINSDSVVDVAESVKPIEVEDNASLSSGFRKPVTNSKLTCLETIREENTSVCSKPKPFMFGNLSSPTANLPNYITDGKSPHKRPEVKVEKKPNLDWLTTFSHQKKFKKVQITKSKNMIKMESKAQVD
ncbi:hypothetical protein Pcinc_022155 [Petrolisthes cinctipes]|uniref:Uncharacterized protein n=1 Tax=Petrolisthes cinctipes TaxID=88211 RepID=A0AAE1FEP1_PETCI|nr:hypothetical protein Pcinc_022155 [Petrolisthes cinctipes]